MKIRFLMLVLLVLALTTACSTQPSHVVETEAPIAQATSETQEISETVDEISPPVETVGSDCLGGEISPVGQSIADDYESTSYEQIITWFCDGAEFEDILVALETEAQTDATADEMLQMLADGFTWEEIWQFVGLTD